MYFLDTGVDNPAVFSHYSAVIGVNPAVLRHNPAVSVENPAEIEKNPAVLQF